MNHYYISTLKFFALNDLSIKFIIGSILVKVTPSLQADIQLSANVIDVNSEVHIQEKNEAHQDNIVTVTGKEVVFCYEDK